MKNFKKMIKGVVVGAMTLTCIWGIGNITHAEEINTVPEYGTIENLGDGKWIGADSLMPKETVDSTDVTETEVDKTENKDNVTVDDATTDEIVSDTTNSNDTVVDDEMVSDDVVVDNVTTNEVVSDTTNSDDTVVDDETNNDEIMTFEMIPSDQKPVVDVSEKSPEVLGDDLYEEPTPVKNTKLNIYEDFVDDFITDDEIKGDDIFPEPTPEPEIKPEPTPEPEKVPERVVPTTPRKVVQETPAKVVKTNTEKTPEVLGDNLFDAPKTGDGNELFFYVIGIILSLGTLITMKRKNLFA